MGAAMLMAVSEPSISIRQQPRGTAELADLTLIVRPPRKPWDIRTFTDAQIDEAKAYAVEHGAQVEPLPLED